MKKAIYISNGVNHYMGGPRGYLANLLDGLLEVGESVDVISTIPSKDAPKKQTAGQCAGSFMGIREILYFFKRGGGADKKLDTPVSGLESACTRWRPGSSPWRPSRRGSA